MDEVPPTMVDVNPGITLARQEQGWTYLTTLSPDNTTRRRRA